VPSDHKIPRLNRGKRRSNFCCQRGERSDLSLSIGEDHRRFLRKKSLLPPTLMTADGSFDCRVLDFSGVARRSSARSRSPRVTA
jgi:hypothetical protein